MAAAAALLVLPASALAGSVSITSTPGQLTYTGDATSNAVTISWSGTAYTVTDSATLAANPASGCVQIAPTTATCPDLNVTSVVARLAPSLNGPDMANSITLDPSLPDDEPATVNGAAGADTFNGQAAAETFNGADGDDVGNGAGGADTLNGDAGGDTLNGDAGDDALNGNNPANTTRTRDGNDTLRGGDGSDVLTGHWGSDDVDGGTGVDRADYGDKEDFDPVGVTLDDDTTRNDGGASDGTAGSRDVVRTNVENVSGGAGADTFTDAVTAASVNNTFNGRGGSDVMNGGQGADNLQGGTGTGNDTVTYAGRTQGLRVTLDDVANDGTFTAGASVENDNVRSDVERVVGGNGDDTIVAQAASVVNVLSGGPGADAIDGGAGNDTLNGDAGADSLTGGAGIDALFGGDDDDRLLARDLTAETTLDCGAGAGDVAQVDPVLDVTTACETLE